MKYFSNVPVGKVHSQEQTPPIMMGFMLLFAAWCFSSAKFAHGFMLP